MLRSTACALFISLSSAPAVCSADTTLEYQGAGTQDQLVIAQGKIRFDEHGSGRWYMFDAQRRALSIVEPAKREFVVMDEGTFDSVHRTVDTVLGQVEAHIANLSPSTRQQLQQAIGAVLPEEDAEKRVRVETTGTRSQAAGHECELSRVFVDGALQSEVCLTSAAKLGLPAADQATVRQWQSFVRTLTEKATRFVNVDTRVFGDGNQLPVIYWLADADRRGELSRVTHAKVDRGLLQVPGDYHRRETPIPLP
jgi:hypothetical protein